MMATQQLSNGALGIFAALRTADPSLKLMDSTKIYPSEMLKCECRNKRERTGFNSKDDKIAFL